MDILNLIVKESIKDSYNLHEDKKDKNDFYPLNAFLEIVVEKKENFKCKIVDGYNMENLNKLLEFKLKRNWPKDSQDITDIRKYLINHS